MPDTATDIDRIDLKILNVLQQDGRISNLKLAESVALSPTAVLARVQRLSRDGFILGYEAQLNPAKLGADLMVFVPAVADPHLLPESAHERSPASRRRSRERRRHDIASHVSASAARQAQSFQHRSQRAVMS